MDNSNLYYGDETLDCTQEEYDAWVNRADNKDDWSTVESELFGDC